MQQQAAIKFWLTFFFFFFLPLVRYKTSSVTVLAALNSADTNIAVTSRDGKLALSGPSNDAVVPRAGTALQSPETSTTTTTTTVALLT